MDTLGTILPLHAGIAEAEHRTEAMERLRYLVHSGASGLICGPAGTGKSWCLQELARQLRREGVSVAQLSLAAVTAEEFPVLFASRLGSGLPVGISPAETWMWLSDYAAACRSSRRRLALLLDQMEYSQESLIAPLIRLMDAFHGSCSWIFAANDSLSSPWKAFLSEKVWLRVELQNLGRRESLQLLFRDMLQRGTKARFTDDGIEAVQEIAQGRIRRLQQLAELASIASEVDGLTKIDAPTVHALAAELVPMS